MTGANYTRFGQKNLGSFSFLCTFFVQAAHSKQIVLPNFA
ncbi:hypothetical protein PALB_23990 [Pseudoalteromonas luteoviolacea B = ATCC 29581]|nr:hypothetical protein PALB_23990 [Pseudoalteromonas luteoviolacea B = ATCC 29581]